MTIARRRPACLCPGPNPHSADARGHDPVVPGREIATKGHKMSNPLPEINPATTERVRARMLVLSRWENEGGAGPAPISVDAPAPSDTEVDQLRMRVIALENLVIALLADATDAQSKLARDMADFISPRPGYTPHPLTLRAAEAMRSLSERADRFRPGKHT